MGHNPTIAFCYEEVTEPTRRKHKGRSHQLLNHKVQVTDVTLHVYTGVNLLIRYNLVSYKIIT